MDFSDLKNTVSNLTLYDIKAGFRKAQNAVMNYTEMEAKVREATNNEPWGASSTTMQEIANGTFNYQTLNEIMPLIYRRFTEKSAEEWRQIYKALQLLEFLIKHGSERVIDDARSHITLLKMLRQFHFIDPNGKDQGVNVRNRAKELTELLGDVERIRSERRKARATKNKYTGVEGGLSFGSGFSSGSRFGGFGSESAGYDGGSATFGGFSGGVYGDGGGFGGQTSDFRDTGNRAEQFEEYDEFEETGRRSASASRPSQTERSERAGVKKTTGEKVKSKEPEVDLFSFDEPGQSAPATSLAPNGSGLADLGTSSVLASGPADDDDEFDDFQSATTSNQPTTSHTSASKSLMPPLTSTAVTSRPIAPPQPLSPPQGSNAQQMLSIPAAPAAPAAATRAGPNYSAFASKPATTQPTQTTSYKPSGPNYFGTVQAQGQAQSSAFSGSAMSSMSGAKPSNGPTTMANMKPVSSSNAASTSTAAAGGDAFGALWGKASAGIKKSGTPTGTGPALGQLAKEKSSAGIWGSPAPQAPKVGSGGATAQANGSASDDLLG